MKLDLTCNVEYFPNFITKKEAKELFDHLVIDLQISPLTMILKNGESFTANFGKLMFIDKNLFEEKKFPENEWGKTVVWTGTSRKIKEKVEQQVGMEFGVCVCIYYPDGSSGVDYHSDYPAFGDTTILPSLSLGEEREFKLREKKTLEEHSIVLEDGSLIIMGEHCQERYEHSLPVNFAYREPRINMTFRAYGFN